MQTKLIVSDPAVMMGKPVIAGTRITVELILEKLAGGETIDQILEAHPRLTVEAIQAALAPAAAGAHRHADRRHAGTAVSLADRPGPEALAFVDSLLYLFLLWKMWQARHVREVRYGFLVFAVALLGMGTTVSNFGNAFRMRMVLFPIVVIATAFAVARTRRAGP